MRKAPEIGTELTHGYAALIAHNFDTVQECFNVRISEELAGRMERAKQDAIQTHDGQGARFMFGGKEFQIWAGASSGNKWVLENDDIQLHFASPKRQWPVIVRYKSAGLWEHGVFKMREYALKAIIAECAPLEYVKTKDDEGKPIDKPVVSNMEDVDKWRVLTRADYAFDFLSPLFTQEMYRRDVDKKIVASSGIKIGTVGTSKRFETITIGMGKAGLQIQIYDKGREIKEGSGKTWMYKVYEQEGYYPLEADKGNDIWRIEIRMRKDFLKDRNLRSFEKLYDVLSEVLAEALMNRRLCEPEGSKRERWPLHPLWAAVYEASGAASQYVPIGRQLSMERREELDSMLAKQQAGLMRARAVLNHGHYSDDYAKENMEEAIDIIHMDEKHDNKVHECVERFRYFDEAN